MDRLGPPEGGQIVGKRRQFVGNEEMAFATSKSEMLTSKSLFLTSKSEMLASKSLFLTSKSEMLPSKSLFLIADVEPRKCF